MILKFTSTPILKYWPLDSYHNQIHALYREGIHTIGDVLKRTDAEILRIPVCGRGTLRVLHQILKDAMREYLEEVS